MIINAFNDKNKQDKIIAKGILKGNGNGNISAVSLPNICNSNLLDNWYFGNPVNQRGASYVENNYGLDRWKGTYGVDANGTMGFNASGFAIQGLEDSVKSILDGMMLTASILYVNGEMIAGTAVYTKTGNAHNFISIGSIQFNNQADGNILLYAKTANQIKAVKLELGSQQTLAHQENGVWVLNEIPKFDDQLMRCYRYAQSGMCCAVVGQLNYEGTAYNIPLNFSHKRTTPTVTIKKILVLGWGEIPTSNATTSWLNADGGFVTITDLSNKDNFIGKACIIHYFASADL